MAPCPPVFWGGTWAGSCPAGGADTDSANETAERESPTEALLARCTALCDRMAQCDDPNCVCEEDVCTCTSAPDATECALDCFDDLGDEFLAQGEACLALVFEALDCMDARTCEELLAADGSSPCAEMLEDASRSEVCDSSEDTASPTARTDGVVCTSSSGGSSVPATSLDAAPAPEQCEMTYSDCSDGRTYSVKCSTEPGSDTVCTCQVDADAPMTVTVAGFACSVDESVVAVCGWPLVL